MGIGDWDLGLEIWIEDWDWDGRLGLEIGDLGLEIRHSGFRIRDWDGHLSLRLAIGN